MCKIFSVIWDYAKHFWLRRADRAHEFLSLAHPYCSSPSPHAQQRREYFYVVCLHIRVLAYHHQRPLVHNSVHRAEDLEHNLRRNHVDRLQNLDRPHEICIQVLLENVEVRQEAAFPLALVRDLLTLVAVPQNAQLLQCLRLLLVQPERRCDKLANYSAQVLGNALAKQVVHQRVRDALDIRLISAPTHNYLKVEQRKTGQRGTVRYLQNHEQVAKLLRVLTRHLAKAGKHVSRLNRNCL